MKLLALLGAALIALSVTVAFAGSNIVPATNAGVSNFGITADTEKPASCNGIALTGVVNGINGTASADLLLGSAAAETLAGKQGNDCILGGGGNDSLNGGPGTDVCIGGPGIDTFNASCETQIQ